MAQSERRHGRDECPHRRVKRSSQSERSVSDFGADVRWSARDFAFDPTETLAAPNGNTLDAGFSPIKVLALAAKMRSPEVGI